MAVDPIDALSLFVHLGKEGVDDGPGVLAAIRQRLGRREPMIGDRRLAAIQGRQMLQRRGHGPLVAGLGFEKPAPRVRPALGVVTPAVASAKRT